MLYIIGGISRSGKTIIARKLLEQHQLPYLSLDTLVMGFTIGIPEYGIHDQLYPSEIAARMWSFTKAICENQLWLGRDYVLEGEAILPSQVKELMDKHPGKIRACFVGYSEADKKQKMDEIKKFSEGTSDWLTKESDEYIEKHVVTMTQYSQDVREECMKYGLKYYETSHEFLKVIDEAIADLTTGDGK